MSKNQRSFRIITVSPSDDIDFQEGIYHGRGPGQAALKAFNWYCRKTELEACERQFTIEEITRGKPQKQFHYTGIRRQLKTPKKIERQGKEYLISYDSSVHKRAALF